MNVWDCDSSEDTFLIAKRVEAMSASGDGPIEAAVSAFMLVVLLVITYAIFTTLQGGNPSGVIETFADAAPGLLATFLAVGVVLWILSEVA
jgi:hypothetical protein